MPEHTVLTDNMDQYLINLRNTGAINMMGAAPYLERDFGLSRQDAKTALIEWMESFDD